MHTQDDLNPHFAHAQVDLNLRILRIFEDTFSLDATQTFF